MSNNFQNLLDSLPQGVRDICARIEADGHEVCVVGGAVRDFMLQRELSDIDLASSATPDKVSKLFDKVIETGIQHGTVTVLSQEQLPIEVTTYRAEGGYSDGRHPDAVQYVSTLEEDLKRRDFTINAMAVRWPGGELVDPFDGKKDLVDRLLRTVGQPRERFAEDGLRLLRAARFMAVLDLELEAKTHEAIKAESSQLVAVAAERQRDELSKLLQAPHPAAALRLLAETGLLGTVLPELLPSLGFEQNRWHDKDVWEHTLAVVEATPADDLALRLAALLHDVGKPATATGDPGERSFHDHEQVGATLVEKAMSRLRFSRRMIDEVGQLVAGHMWHYTPDWSDGAVRRFVVRVGGEQYLDKAFLLREADLRGRGGEGLQHGLDSTQELQTRIEQVLQQGRALTTRDLAIGGREVMQELQLAPGPRVGQLMQQLLEKVLDHPELNVSNELLRLLHEFDRR